MKIAIIGAGAAGLHIAHLLKKQGIHDVVIYEATSRIAGKSVSMRLHDDMLEEMTTCYLTLDYKRLIKLLSDYNLNDELIPMYFKHRWASDDKHERLLVHDYLKIGVAEFLATGKKKPPSRLYANLATAKAYFTYCRLYYKFFGFRPQPPLTPKKSTGWSELGLSTFEFLKKYKLHPLIPILNLTQTSQGYGYIKKTAMYYTFVWSPPSLIYYIVKATIKEPPAALLMLKNGFEGLWQQLATRDNLTINYNHTITGILPQQNNNSLTLLSRDNTSNNCHENNYDCVISSIHPKQFVALFDKNTAAQYKPLQQLQTGLCCTTLIESNKPITKEKVLTPVNNLDESKVGRVIGIRNTTPFNDKTTQVKFYALLLQYYPKESLYSEADAKKKLAEDLEKFNIHNYHIVKQLATPYNAVFDPSNIANGIIETCLALQGKNGCFFTGGGAYFESVNHIMQYNHFLMDRYFNNTET